MEFKRRKDAETSNVEYARSGLHSLGLRQTFTVINVSPTALLYRPCTEQPPQTLIPFTLIRTKIINHSLQIEHSNKRPMPTTTFCSLSATFQNLPLTHRTYLTLCRGSCFPRYQNTSSYEVH